MMKITENQYDNNIGKSLLSMRKSNNDLASTSNSFIKVWLTCIVLIIGIGKCYSHPDSPFWPKDIRRETINNIIYHVFENNAEVAKILPDAGPEVRIPDYISLPGGEKVKVTAFIETYLGDEMTVRKLFLPKFIKYKSYSQYDYKYDNFLNELPELEWIDVDPENEFLIAHGGCLYARGKENPYNQLVAVPQKIGTSRITGAFIKKCLLRC